MPTEEPEAGEFNVWQFFVNNTHECVRDHVSARSAVIAFHHYTRSVAVQMGVVERVIIEDGDGYTTLEWVHGKGITFPPELAKHGKA